MLLILLIWCYLGITFINIGFAFNKFLKLKELDALLTIFFGIFCLTFVASFWAIFGRINDEFQIFLLLLQLLIVLRYKRELRHFYNALFNQFKAINSNLRYFLLLSSGLICFQSSSSSYFVDNETYYLQTIKWINEYGFVPGLANLHIFLGQTSGWHILQSVFSFSYFSNNCNDLNGFCLLLGLAFSVVQLDAYFKSNDKLTLWMGLFPLILVFLFPFSGAPSPDLAVVFLSLILFYYFQRQLYNPSKDSLIILTLLSIFIFYIKISAVPTLLIPVIFYLFYNKKNETKLFPSVIICVFVLGLFIVKSTILTGYPLYPSSIGANLLSTENAIPKDLYDFWWNRAKNYEFVVSQSDFFQLSPFEILGKWLSHSWQAQLISITIVSLLIVVPLFIRKAAERKFLWVIYFAFIAQVSFLLLTTPQYRFVLSYVLFFILVLISLFLTNKKVIYVSLYSSLIIAVAFAMFPKAIGRHHDKIDFNPASFQLSQIVIPQANSNLKSPFSKKTKGNLQYNSPDLDSYIWVTGDGKLPCVNRQQIEYFERKLGYIPQLNGPTLSDGFYSKKVTKP